MKKSWSMMVVFLMACGSTNSAGGPTPTGKQLTDEQVCREDSPCPNVVGSEEEFNGCMAMMASAAEDPCRQVMVDQRVCVVGNTQCDADGNADQAKTINAWETYCASTATALQKCCAANSGSAFCLEE